MCLFLCKWNLSPYTFVNTFLAAQWPSAVALFE